ncbi:hypothetical protein CMI42_04945 [Candidatus Pacearchaeota archaeon]|nr:hypothetical protein [Candidatus Pacearchaeota archaeon]
MIEKKIDWKECCDKRIAKRIAPDTNLINSLKKTSHNKLKSSEELSTSEVTASSKFILAYDSLRELLEALALTKGFKIYNHECYTSFLNEIMNESIKAEEFDEIRKIRNKINYYGEELDIEDSQDQLNKIRSIRNFILNLLK